MNNAKCSNCGLVNFATAEECKRCGESLSAAVQAEPVARVKHQASPFPTTAPVTILPPPKRVLLDCYSINGIGIRLLGYRRLAENVYEVTRWFTVVYLPVVPISTWVIRPVSSESGNNPLSTQHNFQILGRIPLTFERVAAMYMRNYMLAAIAFFPMLFMIRYMETRYPDGGASGYLTGIMILCVMIPVAMLWIQDSKVEKIFAGKD